MDKSYKINMFYNCVQIKYSSESNVLEKIRKMEIPEYLNYFPLKEKHNVNLNIPMLKQGVGYDRGISVDKKVKFDFFDYI